jgi:hypothetical protein
MAAAVLAATGDPEADAWLACGGRLRTGTETAGV